MLRRGIRSESTAPLEFLRFRQRRQREDSIVFLLLIGQIGLADAIVPAEAIHIDERPQQPHHKGSRREIESQDAMATFPPARRLPLKCAEANLGHTHARRVSAINQQQVLIASP